MKFLAEDVIIKSWSNLIDIGENNKASLNKFLGILELLQQLNITQNGSVKSNFEYQIVSNKLSNSLQEKYYFSSGTLKAFNSQEKLYVIFPENWINNIFEILLKSKKLPLEQLVILLFQNDSFPDDCTINDLIDLFLINIIC